MNFIEDNIFIEMMQEFGIPNDYYKDGTGYYYEDNTTTIEPDMEYKYCPYCGRKLKGEFKEVKIH